MKRPRRQLLQLTVGAAASAAFRRDLVDGAERLSEYFGRQFIVENRTGMAGNPATQFALNSAPDGHTLLFIMDWVCERTKMNRTP